jgi:hypothetical protein
MPPKRRNIRHPSPEPERWKSQSWEEGNADSEQWGSDDEGVLSRIVSEEVDGNGQV